MVEQEIERKIENFRELGIPKYVPREGGRRGWEWEFGSRNAERVARTEALELSIEMGDGSEDAYKLLAGDRGCRTIVD